MVPLGLPSARPMAQALRLPFEYYIYSIIIIVAIIVLGIKINVIIYIYYLLLLLLLLLYTIAIIILSLLLSASLLLLFIKKILLLIMNYANQIKIIYNKNIYIHMDTRGNTACELCLYLSSEIPALSPMSTSPWWKRCKILGGRLLQS